MPWSVEKRGDEFCVIRKSDGKVEGCSPTSEKAEAMMRALYAKESLSDLVWFDPFAYSKGKPFRLFPLGTFKRGDRTLDLTEERLRQIAANHAAGRPGWAVPIYAGHPGDNNPDPPKVGNIKSIEFIEGDGLYALPEYNDDGKALVEGGKYQYVSPGIIWSLAGAAYIDNQGHEHDGVLDHVALTNRPYFGAQPAIFSAYSDIVGIERFKDYDTETRREFAKKGWAMPDGSYPIADEGDLGDAIHAIGRGDAPHSKIRAHIMKRARAMGKTDMLPEHWMEDNHMDETTVVKPEEFADLKTKFEAVEAQRKAEAEKFAADLKAESVRAEQFAAELATVKKARALDGLRVRAETLHALPVKADEYAEKFYALGEKDAELAKWFSELLDRVNTLLAQSAVFSQFSRDNAGNEKETIETVAKKVLAEKFGNDSSKVGEALIEAGKQRPDLAWQHYQSSTSTQ